MIVKNTGLILEGGGLRGVYTSGVLRFFMEMKLAFPYVIGVSMGACNAANYVSNQIDRNQTVNIQFVNDPRYISYLRWLRKGELFGMHFIFHTIPYELVPFDWEAFFNRDMQCITAVTDCITGEPVYFDKNRSAKEYSTLLQASCSLPFINQPVHHQGRVFMDGGLSDSIPIHKSIADGNTKNVIILTQPRGYRKKPSIMAPAAAIRYPQYKGLQQALAHRHTHYNHTLAFIEQGEKSGTHFVIRPSKKLHASRVERNQTRLHAMFELGYEDARQRYPDVLTYLHQ